MTLDELKAKHGTVYTLEIPTNEEGSEKATIYLRKLDRLTFTAVSKVIQKDELQATEVLLKALYIGGDELSSILNDFDNLRSASNAIVPMLQAKEASLKKN
jgi:hypothetical protein